MDAKHLTPMSRTAIETAAIAVSATGANALIVSASYDTAQKECDLYMKYAVASGVEPDKIHALIGVTNSYDEASRAVKKAVELEAEKLVVVAEWWHAARSEKAFRSVCPEGLALKILPFPTMSFERTLEPSAIKSWRTNWKLTWILWNVLLGLLPASVLERVSGNVQKK